MKVTAITPKTLLHDEDGEDSKAALEEFIEQVTFILNGNTDLLVNVKTCFVTAQFTSTVQNLSVPHNLGRLARGYFVVGKSGPADIYNSTVDWTSYAIFLKSTAPVTAKIVVF